MTQRIPSEIRKSRAKLIIILGGTNDLHKNPPIVIDNIIKLHRIAHTSAKLHLTTVYTIAITLPQVGQLNSRAESNRLQINDGIICTLLIN